MQKILQKALNKVKPGKAEQKFLKSKVDGFLKKLNKAIPDQAVAIVGGSAAKGTWLKNDYDVDIFARFNLAYQKEDISKILEKSLAKLFKKSQIEILHGSRDYYQVKSGKFTFEIVPVLDIKNAGQAINVTDVSPLHADFVIKEIKKKPKLADEIRLAKQFCKAANVYGAESYIKGFSGYLVEVLVIYAGSFEKFIKLFSKIKEKEVIDFMNYYKNRNVFREMNISKIYSPLIVVDPVQKDRNIAAALSKEKFLMLKKAAIGFCKNPSLGFFEVEKIDIKELKKAGALIINAKPLKGKNDVVGSKLLKVYDFVKRELEENDFTLKDSGWAWEKEAIFWFMPEQCILPDTKIRIGPPARAKQNAAAFRAKYPNSYEQKARLYAVVKRQFREADKFIKEYVLKSAYIKDKVLGVHYEGNNSVGRKRGKA